MFTGDITSMSVPHSPMPLSSLYPVKISHVYDDVVEVHMNPLPHFNSTFAGERVWPCCFWNLNYDQATVYGSDLQWAQSKQLDTVW